MEAEILADQGSGKELSMRLAKSHQCLKFSLNSRSGVLCEFYYLSFDPDDVVSMR